MSDDETWRPVAGYEGSYEVSDKGRVQSLDRRVQHGRWQQSVRGRILSPAPGDKYGHLNVTLSREGRQKTLSVHRLVAIAFVPGRQPGLEVCHGDGKAGNNLATNLRWDTSRENSRDTVRHGANVNAARRHCPRGHAYTPNNTRTLGSSRACIACSRMRDLKRAVAEAVTKLAEGRTGSRPKTLRVRTQCPHGHPYSPENTYVAGSYKQCKTCRATSKKKFLDKKAATK
jgi:hypothetical protein